MALRTEIAATRYVPLYSNPDGSSQTWYDTVTGDEFAFAGADAATLAEYYAARGDVALADRYAGVALAQNRYTGVVGTGEYYDALPALGTIFENTGTINGNLVSKGIGQYVIDTPTSTASDALKTAVLGSSSPTVSASPYLGNVQYAGTDIPEGATIVPTGTSGGGLSGTEYAARNAALGKYLTADNAGTVSIVRGATSNSESVAASYEGNLVDAAVEALNMGFANSAVSVIEGWENNDVSALVPGVAGVVGTGAVQVLAPVDLLNVGNKLVTGRGGELEPTDWVFAGLDAVALIAGFFSAGVGYAGLKGLSTLAKGAKYASYAGQAIGIPVAVAWELNKGGKE